MKNKAFTMIEFLVVVAIVSILAAILYPVIFRGNSQTAYSEFDGCMEPKVISTTPVTNPLSGRSEVEYIYRCDDGRQIASRIKPQDIR